MKQLLIAYHSQTGHTQQLVEAAYQGAIAMKTAIAVQIKPAAEATVADMRQADAYLFASPENFGYMSGELKALFDRTYEQSREYTAGKSYALLIACDNDGSGAKTAIERILRGYQMKSTQQCVIAKGDIDEKTQNDAQAVGKYLAMALSLGII